MTPSLGAIWTYRQGLPEFGYNGDAKLGEKERLVFWYLPQGAKTYKAVFGDLRVEDITTDQIPQAEK